MADIQIKDGSQVYNLKHFPLMRPQGPHMPMTDTYVSVPPAAYIRDEEGALWTLGYECNANYGYDIVRNGVKTGDFGWVIDFRRNSKGTRVVRIWDRHQWRSWNGRQFV